VKKSPPIEAFLRAGFARRHAFSHEVAVVPKRYPDALLHLRQHNVPLSTIVHGVFKQINVYATNISKYPEELFRDLNVNWHGQQCSRLGLIAAAGLFLPNHHIAIITTMQSDVCQQLYRHPSLKSSCKTQIDKWFERWYRLLLNAVVDFCNDHSIGRLYVPTSGTVLQRVPRAVSPALFVRIYDDPSLWLQCTRRSLFGTEYWEIPIDANQGIFVPLEPTSGDSRKPIRGVCIFHDVEANVDTLVSPSDCLHWLNAMLDIETQMGLSLTYSVLGKLLPALRPLFQKHGIRSLALHSFDHQIGSLNQIRQVRRIDGKIHGYRPPQSKITPELTDFNLSFYNFEWLLSSAGSIGLTEPQLQNYIVKIPVHMDDYPLQTGRYSINEWIGRLRSLLDSNISLVTIGTHDCYARQWLEYYPQVLRECIAKGPIWNCDDIADTVYYNAFL
jgi:hypothetical protein